MKNMAKKKKEIEEKPTKSVQRGEINLLRIKKQALHYQNVIHQQGYFN